MPRGHATIRLEAAHPALVNAGGVDEGLFHLVGGFGFLGGHGCGSDEDAVDRHAFAAVFQRPVAGNILCSLVGGTNAAAGDDDHVGALPQLFVGGEQQIVKVDPGMVTASVPIFNLYDDVGFGVGVSDFQNAADLSDGARFEGDVGVSVGVQVGDELVGFLQFGDAGGNGDAVDGRTCGTSLGNDTLLTKLEVPHVPVEEHGVELGATAGLQLGLEIVVIEVEDFLRILAAACHFRPVASVSCGSNNIGVHGGGGHAGQDDGRQAGKPAEGGLNLALPGGELDDARREIIKVDELGQFSAGGGEIVTLSRGGAIEDDGVSLFGGDLA